MTDHRVYATGTGTYASPGRLEDPERVPCGLRGDRWWGIWDGHGHLISTHPSRADALLTLRTHEAEATP